MRYLHYIACLSFAILLITAAMLAYADDLNAPIPAPVGRVVWVKGTLTAVMENKEVRTLQKTSIIYQKDTLITDGTSQAQVVFTDNTLMTFREGTKFFIDQYAYNPQQKKGSVGKYIVNLIEGGFRTITGAIAKTNPPDYQVNTPVATIGVRGTDYAVYIKNGEIFVGYYTGKPCVKGKGKSESQEICLDDQNPYAKVAGFGEMPILVPIGEQPEGFKVKLEITATKITPFSATSGEQLPYTPKNGGPITSFCITQ